MGGGIESDSTSTREEENFIYLAGFALFYWAVRQFIDGRNQKIYYFLGYQ